MCVPLAKFSSKSQCFSISQVFMTPAYRYQQHFLIFNSAKTPVAVVVLSRLCFEVYDVARLMKCWYSELAISKSSVIQGSKYIRHVGDFCMRCCTCLNYFGCLLSDSFTRFNSMLLFCYKVSFARFFVPVHSSSKFFRVNLM